MNETGTAARAWMNPTESEQRAETQIRRPSLRLISGLEKTESAGRVGQELHDLTSYTLPRIMYYMTMDNIIRFRIFEGFVGGIQVTTRYNRTPASGTGDTDNMYLWTLGYSFDTTRKR